MQVFKGDATELKMIAVMEPLNDLLSSQRDLFLDGAYTCVPLGNVLYDGGFAPLSKAISREIYSAAFSEIFQAFVDGGTFESYLTVFTKIFGEDVEVEFTVPAPGKLNIDITAPGTLLSDFIARRIEDNEYLFDEVIDDEGDNIAFFSFQGFESQYELEQMLFEMVPGGIFTTITLNIV